MAEGATAVRVATAVTAVETAAAAQGGATAEGRVEGRVVVREEASGARATRGRGGRRLSERGWGEDGGGAGVI